MSVSRTKRPHFVQRAYIERFTRSGKVVVRRRDGGLFDTDPVNVAVQAGLYDFGDAGGSSTEADLTKIEDDALDVIRAIDQTGRPPIAGTPGRGALLKSLAVQMTRTPEERERVLFPKLVAEYAGTREVTIEVVAEYLEDVHLGVRPRDAEISAAFDYVTVALRHPATLTDEFAIAMMFKTAETAAPMISALHWTIETDRKEGFMTSDTPLVIWRPPSVRDRFEGVGVESAEELRFPLDPGKQLVASKRLRTPAARVTPDHVRGCNVDLAAACYEFVIAPPHRRAALEALPLARRRPALRFNEGPVYGTDDKGNRRKMGDVLHMWVPRRS